jgi:hypothetical protein
VTVTLFGGTPGAAPDVHSRPRERSSSRCGACRARVPDAVQRVAAQTSLRNLRKLDCAAERCTADPGPSRRRCAERSVCGTVPGLQRITLLRRLRKLVCVCRAAPGTRAGHPIQPDRFRLAMDARVKPAHDDAAASVIELRVCADRPARARRDLEPACRAGHEANAPAVSVPRVPAILRCSGCSGWCRQRSFAAVYSACRHP